MKLTRRAMIGGAAAGIAAAGSGMSPRWAHAALDLGGLRIETLSDGHLVLPPDFIFGPMPQDQLGAVLQENGMAAGVPLEPECNVTLLRDGENVILFDTGAGAGFQDTAGKISDALEAVDLAPEDVTHVVFTHAHPDHLWGVLDEFDDPFFYEAEHMIGKAEWDYWIDPKTVDTIESARTTMAVGAQRRLAAMEDAMRFFEDGEEILPGVAARMTPGHTPGHMSFEIRTSSESVMVVGDAIGNHHVAFARPGWRSGSDQDRDLGAATRKGLLDQLASEQMRLIGFHLPGGGIGRAEKQGEGYRFVQET